MNESSSTCMCCASVEVGHLASAKKVTTLPENKAVRINQEGVKLWREDGATDLVPKRS